MPTPKRPQPEFPDYGFLGELPNLGGSSSTELAITIPHPTIPGYWTNVPLLFPGQEATSTLGGPGPVSREQYRRADDFARVLETSGYQLPAFKTVDEAVFEAGHRHKAVAARPSQLFADPTAGYPALSSGQGPGPSDMPPDIAQVLSQHWDNVPDDIKTHVQQRGFQPPAASRIGLTGSPSGAFVDDSRLGTRYDLYGQPASVLGRPRTLLPDITGSPGSAGAAFIAGAPAQQRQTRLGASPSVAEATQQVQSDIGTPEIMSDASALQLAAADQLRSGLATLFNGQIPPQYMQALQENPDWDAEDFARNFGSNMLKNYRISPTQLFQVVGAGP